MIIGVVFCSNTAKVYHYTTTNDGVKVGDLVVVDTKRTTKELTVVQVTEVMVRRQDVPYKKALKLILGLVKCDVRYVESSVVRNLT